MTQLQTIIHVLLQIVLQQGYTILVYSPLHQTEIYGQNLFLWPNDIVGIDLFTPGHLLAGLMFYVFRATLLGIALCLGLMFCWSKLLLYGSGWNISLTFVFKFRWCHHRKGICIEGKRRNHLMKLSWLGIFQLNSSGPFLIKCFYDVIIIMF